MAGSLFLTVLFHFIGNLGGLYWLRRPASRSRTVKFIGTLRAAKFWTKTDLSGNLTSEYIFGVYPERTRRSGARIARRDASGNVFYYLTDHLDSSRVIVQAGQTTPCFDADYGPFGSEHDHINSCPQNYKFTGKERDPESGLDNFEARYYGSSIGRFTSPDDPFVGWQLNDPQSLNLYAYVQDNPINDVDPTGHCLIVNGGSVMQCGFSELEAAMNTMTIRVGTIRASASPPPTLSASPGPTPSRGRPRPATPRRRRRRTQFTKRPL